jgi:hypothetical protein
MVIFIESIIFADVLGYIYEKNVINFSYIYILITILSLSCKIILERLHPYSKRMIPL